MTELQRDLAEWLRTEALAVLGITVAMALWFLALILLGA